MWKSWIGIFGIHWMAFLHTLLFPIYLFPKESDLWFLVQCMYTVFHIMNPMSLGKCRSLNYNEDSFWLKPEQISYTRKLFVCLPCQQPAHDPNWDSFNQVSKNLQPSKHNSGVRPWGQWPICYIKHYLPINSVFFNGPFSKSI